MTNKCYKCPKELSTMTMMTVCEPVINNKSIIRRVCRECADEFYPDSIHIPQAIYLKTNLPSFIKSSKIKPYVKGE